MAVKTAYSLGNVTLYMESLSRARDVLGPNLKIDYDEKWVTQCTRALNDRVARLEADVLNAKRDSEREPTKVERYKSF